MSALLEDVMKMAEKLNLEEQSYLIQRLRLKQLETRVSGALNRESLLQKLEVLRQTPVKEDSRLLGKYANPQLPEVSEADFHAELRAIGNEWEQELDELTNDES